MSVELLPPLQEYPKEFHVRFNLCQCHPETCGCNLWAIYDAEGRKLLPTYFRRSDADANAAALNEVKALRAEVNSLNDTLDGAELK